jgi:hypothetical protein
MTSAELRAKLAALEEENAKLKTQVSNRPATPISLKVSEKGPLSIYGLGRFPVTLYKGQMKRLIEKIPDIQSFMAANDARLVEKSAS